MTWLYVPETFSACAQGSEDLNSESCSLSTAAPRLVAGSVTWRGKPQQQQAWSRRWKQGGFIRRLSGLTCSPSTLDRGVEQFISSLVATPAKTTALQESAPEQAAIASSHPKSAASPKSAGLILSSERTCRGTRTDNSQPSSRHWSDWATALRQEYSVRPKPEIPCAANDCSSWPAVRVATGAYTRDQGDPNKERPSLEGMAQEWMAPVADDTGLRTKRYGQGGMALSMQADQWMAPQVPNGGRSTAHAEQVGNTLYHEGKKVQLGLESQARQWMTPMTADTGQKVTHATKQYSLIQQAERDFCLPPSSLDQPIVGGSICSTDSPNTNQPSVKRKLNPIFVEALMRWPTGLSGFERPETAWTQWWQLMPSYLSQLCTTKPEQQPDLFGEAA